jgi:alkylation response protein AidB-like acyl-CoA dehydrogenase
MLLRRAPEHVELQAGLRRLLDTAAGPAEVLRLHEKDASFDPTLVSRLADELGVFGLAVPEQYGGAGYGLVELGVVFAEAGRALLCAPLLSASLYAQLLLSSGDDDACAQYLPAQCAATSWGTVAVVEGDSGWADDPTTTAERSGAGWVLTGSKDWVLDAPAADVLIVSAATPGGTALFLLDATSAGVVREPVDCVDLSRRIGRVRLDGAPATLLAQGATARAA